jgi:hypothetical protein
LSPSLRLLKRFVRYSSRYICLKSATVPVNGILAPENGFCLLQSRQPTSSAFQWLLSIDSCAQVASLGSKLATTYVISDSYLLVIALTIVIISDPSPLGLILKGATCILLFLRCHHIRTTISPLHLALPITIAHTPLLYSFHAPHQFTSLISLAFLLRPMFNFDCSPKLLPFG